MGHKKERIKLAKSKTHRENGKARKHSKQIFQQLKARNQDSRAIS
jgi:hypothetical protein